MCVRVCVCVRHEDASSCTELGGGLQASYASKQVHAYASASSSAAKSPRIAGLDHLCPVVLVDALHERDRAELEPSSVGAGGEATAARRRRQGEEASVPRCAGLLLAKLPLLLRLARATYQLPDRLEKERLDHR
eukprot:1741053-Pleurochrysis_carterae.AAC.1